MERFIKGDIVVVPFPFSDLSDAKRRPALVLADLPGDDIILCQITSQHTKDRYAVPLTQSDFISGSLPADSFIRPSRIFTADKNIIVRKTGAIESAVLNIVLKTIADLFQ